MNDLVAGLLRLLLRAVMLVAALIVVASLLLAAVVFVLGFGVRLLWARITGRPIVAFGMPIDPFAVWRRMRAQPAARDPAGARRAPGGPLARADKDVQDVEVKMPSEH